MPIGLPAPDGPPSSPDADHRYTDMGPSHSWHPRHQPSPHRPLVGAESAEAGGRNDPVAVVDSECGVGNSSGAYLQPVGQRIDTTATLAADGSRPSPPPPPAWFRSEARQTLSAPRGGALAPSSASWLMHGGDAAARSVDMSLHDYEEVPENWHHAYARPKELRHSTDLAEMAILLPQKLTQDQALNGRSPGRKCTNPLYSYSYSGKLSKMAAESGHSVGKSIDANGDFSNSVRRSTKSCCTQACTVGMLAILLSTAAVILAILSLLGINLMSKAEKQTYQAVSTNDALDEQINQLENLLKDLVVKVNKQEALLNETTTKASAGISPWSRCRYHQLTATNGNTDWIPEAQNWTAIGASCYMRSGDEWMMEAQAFSEGPSYKRKYRCNCKSRAIRYYCIITYWLCPDIL